MVQAMPAWLLSDLLVVMVFLLAAELLHTAVGAWKQETQRKKGGYEAPGALPPPLNHNMPQTCQSCCS